MIFFFQRLGSCQKINPDQAIDSAVSLATQADAVLFLGGLSPEWESEGFDRPNLKLPGRQDEVITRLAEANMNTIVCIQAVSTSTSVYIGTHCIQHPGFCGIYAMD
jgi:beta-glucosidase